MKKTKKEQLIEYLFDLKSGKQQLVKQRAEVSFDFFIDLKKVLACVDTLEFEILADQLLDKNKEINQIYDNFESKIDKAINKFEEELALE